MNDVGILLADQASQGEDGLRLPAQLAQWQFHNAGSGTLKRCAWTSKLCGQDYGNLVSERVQPLDKRKDMRGLTAGLWFIVDQ
jgi:hypothetical protein